MGSPRGDPRHQRRMVRCLIGVFGGALLLGGAAVVSPVALAAAPPLTWAAPVSVDSSPTMLGVSCPGTGLCVAVGSAGDVVTSTDPTGGAADWTVTDGDGSNSLDGASCPSSGLCVAVDNAGNVVTSTNPTGGASAWTATHVDGTDSLRGVSCPSSGLCVAVDNAGDVAISTNPTGGAAAWTVTDVDGTNALSAVSCPASTLCVAVDGAGNTVTSTNPTGGASAWKVTDVDGSKALLGVSCFPTGPFSVIYCVASDNQGDVVTSGTPTGSTWTVTHVDTFYDLRGVSCLRGLCVAVDNGGEVVTSTNPTATPPTWTLTDEDGTNWLYGVSCPSSGLCVAVDGSGNVVISTNPAAATPSWTLSHIGGSYWLDGVSCPSSGLCVAVDSEGDVVTSTNPTGGTASWTVTRVDGLNQLQGVSCPSSGLCVAVDAAGNVVTSTSPAGGVSAWTVTHVEGYVLYGVSCPSSGLCVAVDDVGDVVTSTNPTGGAAAWTVTDVDSSNLLDGVSCPGSGVCVAVDNMGNVVTSANPTGGASAWTVADADGSKYLHGVSCPSTSLCVAVDGSGDVVTSTNPTGGAAAWTVTDVDGTDALSRVSCPSSGLCVAVDEYGNSVTSTNPTGAWTVTSVDGSNELFGVSCPSSGLCVAVDDDGNVVTGVNSASLQDVPSTQQYFLHGSDGSTWQPMDASLLADTFRPATTGTALFSANADLWTENAGFNQDIGICLVAGALVPTSCPSGDLLAWKESGGFAGTYSPNAAYVQATATVTAGTTETAFVVWKTNKLMPAGDTIAAGAGGGPSFSPVRLTVTLPDASDAVSGASSTLQYAMNGSDGSTWKYVDTTNLALTLTPASGVDTVLSANADLWTEDAGFNQDVGICLAAGATLPTGSCPSADVIMWKESGGFAGTFSPNAAFAQTVVPMSAGTYSVALVWKANKPMPGTDTIMIGAGSGPYSPTRLVALQYPASGGEAAVASSAEQYSMTDGSNGSTWQVLDATHLTLTVNRATGCEAEVGGNVDLWTDAAGFNQDIGIQVTPAGGSPSIAAWKESGGFAGTFSPNAAYVEAVIPISIATSYSITLVWKTNVGMPSSDYIDAAAGGPGAYSPTTLTATVHC
jgi:hypothetical protein